MLFPWFFPLVHTTNEDLSSGFCIINVIPRGTKQIPVDNFFESSDFLAPE